MTLGRRPGPTQRTRVQEWSEEGDHHREDRLVTEEPLEVRLAVPGRAPERVWVTMRTPGHDFELAAGWCLHEGLIRPDDLRTVAYCTDQELSPEEEFNVVTLTATAAGPASHRHQGFSAGSSACGVCGKESVGAVLDVASGPRWSGALPGPDVVRRLPGLLREHQRLFDRTGGLHAAGLFDAEGHLLVVREDVGRHNAVDKVTGARLLAGDSPQAACLAVSGRAGFELVQKAVSAGVGSFVAVGAPTSLAVDLARRAELPLYGFTGSARTVRYA